MRKLIEKEKNQNNFKSKNNVVQIEQTKKSKVADLSTLVITLNIIGLKARYCLHLYIKYFNKIFNAIYFYKYKKRG